MPLYRIDVPGQGTFRVESPTELSDDQVWQAVQGQIQAPVPKGERTFGEAAQDIGAGLLGGVGSLVQLPGQIGQLAFGMEPGAVTKTGEDIRKYAQSLKSPELVAREQERARKVAEAEKSGQLAAFGTAFGETVKDPALLLTFLAEQAPQLLVPFTAARAGVAGARALGAGAKAAGTAGVGAAVGAGAVQQGADVGANAYKDIHDELIKQGASEKEAAEGALRLARQAGASAATISALTQLLPGARIAERVFAGVPVRGAGRLKAAGAAAAGETISEIPEEVGGKIAANIAMREVKPEQDILAGTGEAAAMAAIGAGTLGGAVGAMGRPVPAPEPPPVPEITPEAPAPQAPTPVQQQIEGITGVTQGERQTPATPVLTAEQIEKQRRVEAEQRRLAIDEAARQEAERAAREGPRPQVPVTPPTEVSRFDQEVPQPTPREELERRQAEIDRMRLEAGLPTSKGVMPETAKPELPTEPKIVDNRPLNDRAAKNRLLVMRNMLQREGGDPNSLSIVPHPTAKGKFAIQSLDRPVRLKPELPQTAITRPETPKIIDPIDAYIEIARRTNTPAARLLVRDFENGVLTRADIGLAVEAERRAGQPLPLNYKGNGEPWFLAPEERKPRGERELPPGAKLTREPPEGPPRPFVGPETPPGFTPPTKPETPPEKPGEEPPPPTGTMPQTLEEFKQRMPIDTDKPDVRTANEQGNFRNLADAMAKSQNPVIRRVGQLALPVADKIMLKKPAAPGKLGGRAIGIYRYADDSIQMDTRYAGSEWVNAHETVHALVARAQRNPSPKQAPYVRQIEDLYNYTKKELARRGYNAKNTYGLTNEREFVSEAMSNPDFQYLLMQVPYKGRKSAWTEFVRIVANLLGIQNTNALTEVLNLVDKLAQVKRPIRTPFDKKAVEYVGQEPKFVEDIPNENWLQEKVDYARSRPRNQFGVPKMSSTTGYFREGTVYVPTRWAKELKGQRGEQENVRPQDLAAIRKIIRETGKFPLTEDGKEYVPYIEVGYDGVPFVSEGNHRIMAAAAEGLEYIPVEIRYFDGGQRKAGKWAPDSVLETTRNAMARGEVEYAGFEGVTPEQREANFKRWFGNSKVVDKDGKPLVVYHGTNADFRAFRPTRIGEFGPAIYFSSTPAEAGAYAGVPRPGQENGAPNIIPVYLSLKNPYTKGVDAFWKEFGRENETDAQAIERAKSAGYDGVIEQKKDWRDKPFQHYIAFNPNQIKSAIGNRGTFGPEAEIDALELPFGKKKEESTPTGTGQQAMQIVAATGMTAKPPEPTLKEQAKDAWKQTKENPKLAASTAKKALRDFTDNIETWAFSGDAKFNNDVRRALISDLNENPEVMGMLLEASQSQAVHSDALATQFIIEGGMAYDEDAKKWVAVKKEDNFIKLAQKIEALAKKHGLSKENAERVAHTYFVAKRFRSLAQKQDQRDAEIARLEAEAKREQDPVRRKGLRSEIDKLQKAEVFISDQQRALIEPGLSLAKLMPELDGISDTWQAIRVNAIKALVDSGMWNLEYAEAMFDNIDYVPFYREEQLEEGGGPQEFIKGLQVKAKEHRLKGSESPVNDVFDNMVRWTQYAINRAVRNHKALQMIDLGKEINVGDQKMVTQVEKKEKGENVVRVFRDGVQELYTVADPMYMEAFSSISNVAIPSLRFFSWMSNMLRQSVVLYPLFSLAQIPQDSISAIFTSGLKPQYAFRIPVLAVKEFIKTLRKTSATHNTLKQYGAVGVRDFSAAVARQDVEIAAGLKAPKGLVGKTVEGLSHIAMAADNAIRQAVYEASMKQGLSKAEALEKAFDIINFRRRGTSKMINLMGQVVPFFYAYMSVQRVALKTLSGVGISPTTRGEALKTLGYTTAGVMALSLLYAMAAAGDDEYEKTPVAIRDRTLHIPGTAVRIPLRPDFFLFPKMVTEHLYHLITDNGLSDGAKFRKSMFDGFVNAAASPQPIPQAAKPLLEVAINYDFFQGRPIIGPFEQKKEAERQFNDNTSELSKILGGAMGYSPEKLDHIIRGMFGSAGGLTLWATNLAISPFGEVPRPDKSFQDALASIPGTSGFVTKSTESRLKNDFYELRDEVVKADETFKDIAKRTPQELDAFLDKEKNLVRLGLVKTVEDVTRELSKIRSAISQTTNLPADIMTASEKKDFIEQLREAEKALLEGIDVKELRKMAQM